MEQKLDTNAAVTAISWTGGKDCNLALLRASRDPTLSVRYLVVFCLSNKAFKAHPVPFMREQARSLNLELLFIDIPDGSCNYFEEYVNGIRNLNTKYGVEVISTGDMDLVGTMEQNWMEKCCIEES